jgi:hypothetical protein
MPPPLRREIKAILLHSTHQLLQLVPEFKCTDNHEREKLLLV